jgi:hypothetical protein
MELLRIIGGLSVIGVIVVLVGLSNGGGGSGAAPERPAERTFAAGDSAARFVAPPGD